MEEESKGIWDWLSWDWFEPEVLKSFDWENPFFFSLIPVVWALLLVKWLLYHWIRRKLDVSYRKQDLGFSFTTILRFIPDILFAISLSLILVALARPQKTNETVERFTEGIDIMLVMDISESMKISDFKPNRMEAAKKTAVSFVNGRFQDRIGIVIFSGEAYSLSPLTTDYQLLKKYINDISISMIEKGGTAIGSALAVGVNRMRETRSKSKILILMSDGENNAGNIDPLTAAELAKAYNIKVYTILMGKTGKVEVGRDFFNNPVYQENTVDESALRKIAEIGEGQFFRAPNNQSLNDIFSRIDKMEKSEIKENRYTDTRDFYDIYLKWAILVFLFWLLLKSTFITNAIED